MKLSSDYSSDISSLLNMKKNDSLFISTWDKDEEVLPFPFTKIKEYNKLDCHQANKYFFSDEFLDLKNYILSENIEFKKIILHPQILLLYQMELLLLGLVS